MARKRLSKRDIAFWRAWFEIRSERVSLVDNWDDGSTTWKPRILQKMLWYSKTPQTIRNRHLVYEWLMQNCAKPLPPAKTNEA
jgi:hypothetical protein